MAVAPTAVETSASAPEPQLRLAPEDIPNVEDLVTEDDTPVDNLFSGKQQRLLVETLQTSWEGPGGQRPFVAEANMGVFYALHQPPLVPDAFLSLDVRIPPEPWAKNHRSYFLWEYGKPPDVVVEVVSNRKGEELTRKLALYARIGVIYYIVHDPFQQLSSSVLQVHVLHAGVYQQTPDTWLHQVGLGVTLWDGVYEDMTATWLRWCDHDGRLIATGRERAEEAQQQAARAQQQAAQAQQQAEQERQRAERFVAQLRALGIEPREP